MGGRRELWPKRGAKGEKKRPRDSRSLRIRKGDTIWRKGYSREERGEGTEARVILLISSSCKLEEYEEEETRPPLY